MVSIQVRIHIEQFAERYLSANTLKINFRRIRRTDLKVRNVEVAIVAVSIASDKVGQLPLGGG